MADDKKKAAPPQKSLANEMIFLFAGLFILSALIARITYVLGTSVEGGFVTLFRLDDLFHYFKTEIYPVLSFISYLVSACAFVCCVIVYRKLSALNKAEYKKYGTVPEEAIPYVEPANKKWQQVLAHLNSENPNDWKFAIIEADIMLDELLDRVGYKGSTIGDKLKSVEASDFLTLQNAWDAHKVRNQIAHEGSSFLITEREAKRVIGLFESVFREFGMI